MTLIFDPVPPQKITLPTADHRRTSLLSARALHAGWDAVVHGWIGLAGRRQAQARLREDSAVAHEAAAELEPLSPEALRKRLQHFRELFRRGEALSPEAEVEALATVAETARRELGLRPYEVQLMGALAVWRGYLLEMATGEGKTLTVTLAAVLTAWIGRPCHVLTSNDYLAARDAAWGAPLFRACGVTAGCVTGEMKSAERKANYERAIVYSTSKEVVADFLRDRLQLGELAHSTRRLLRDMMQPGATSQEGLVMRGVFSAIVDEADSALIDEAVTPLLISREQENEPLKQACSIASSIALSLEAGRDYTANEKHRDVVLLHAGFAKVESRTGELPAMWRGVHRAAELVTQALRAREFYHLGKQYVVEEGKIVIVDEYTGRLMHQRTWREGLHQAVEAKEGLNVTTPMETLARLSFQHYFRLYQKFSGLSGTVWEAAQEIWHIYRLPVVKIPTHRPCQRIELPDRIFNTQAEKWDAVVAEIAARHAKRQPILIGTRSVASSEQLASRLASMGLSCTVLNATRTKEEASIVEKAGASGCITVSTNMAGRGTDIKLEPGVTELGGLHVILTERHESRRIDRQLMGRAARQGDPGSAQAFVSMEDELLLRHAPGWLLGRTRNALSTCTPGAESLARSLIERAQKRSESSSRQQRKSVLEMDTWLEDALSFTQTDLPG